MFFDDDDGDFTPKGAAGGYVKQSFVFQIGNFHFCIAHQCFYLFYYSRKRVDY